MRDCSEQLKRLDFSPGTLILTPNNSVAESLLGNLLKQRARQSLPANNILSLTAWLREFLGGSLGHNLASEIQLQLIWEETIESLDLGFDMHAPTLAPMALKAWRYMKQWQVPTDEMIQAEYGQEMQFHRWCSSFEKCLDKLQLFALEQLAEMRIKPNESDIWRKILLVGFLESPAPLWQNLLESCSNTIETIPFIEAKGFAQQYEAENTEEEISAAAIWTKQSLDENPEARIGLIATQDRKTLVQTQRALWLTGIDSGLRKPMRDEGVIEAALRLLRLNLNVIELADARAIAQSPFFGNHLQDLKLRGAWEQRICALQTRSISRSDFFYCLRESAPFSALRETLRKSPAQLAPIEWAERFHRQLKLIGWPGERALTESQAHAYEAWPELLGDLAALGSVRPSLTAAQAVQHLAQVSIQHTFLTNASARVQLLDRIEAAADFDRLWLFGCDEEHWPGNPSPQPLLPISIQARYGMPRCSAEQEFDLSKRLLSSLQQRGNQVVYSFSRTTGDQIHHLTPLLKELPNLNIQTFSPQSTPSNFEFIDCSSAPALGPDEQKVRGGARLMQLMASSPFDAFAQYRLHAFPLETPFEGISPAQLGLLVHDLMDRFWADVQNSDALLAMSQIELESLVHRLVEATFMAWSGARKTAMRQTRLIKDQLEEVLLEWLPQELQREGFRVFETEQSLKLSIGGIELRLRIDRIDQTPSGLLLIDYKSGGSGSIEDWRSIPPSEPQLPLYCLALGEDVSAIAFAKLKRGDTKWIALGREALTPRARIEESWSELIQSWNVELTQLAEAFAQGDSRVRETRDAYFQDDPLKALHRFNEIDELEKCLAKP